jgi:cell division septal protein FtsQ
MKRRFTFIALPILLLLGSTYALGYSSIFTVSAVEIIGIKSSVNAGVLKGEKLARIEPRVIASKFENLAWVKKAEVSRNWINGVVSIRILEREPVAIYRGKAFDLDGKTFEPQSGLPTDLVQIEAVDAASALEAINFLTSLDSELRQSLQVIKVQRAGFFDLVLAQDERTVEVKWGLSAENELKTRVYKTIFTLPENSKVTRVDLSAPHAPLVK